HYEFEGEGQTVLVIHNMTSTTKTVDVDYVKLLYGNLELPAYGTIVLEIDSAKINDYIS
ncbi:hypothetical protein HXX03_04185, partial [Acholeplasma laidlawii]|nr:hypothetical protein [Acholeplasma laidlawii]